MPETKYPQRLNVRRDSAAARILLERKRQIEVLGYGPEKDDRDRAGNIALAAAGLAAAAYGHNTDEAFDWPWDEWDIRFDQPKTSAVRIRLLEKAGALILAELEKELRAIANS